MIRVLGHTDSRAPESLREGQQERARGAALSPFGDHPARLADMEYLSEEEFESILDEAIDQLPSGVTDELDNVALFVEDRPEDGNTHLLGLYDGTPIGERGISGLELPDNIFLYRDNLIAYAEDRDHLRSEIVITIVHEIAHFYGIDDERLHEIGWG